MRTLDVIFDEFKEFSDNPKDQFDKYLASGKDVVLCAPMYAPLEIVHSMGLVPFGVWGSNDIEITEAKRYFPAFIPSILQSILELGIKGKYDGAKAMMVPLLSDSLKCLGENWKYAVPNIKYIPVQYPQNRRKEFGIKFSEASYQRIIKDLEDVTGTAFNNDELLKSIKIYNEHNSLMRDIDSTLSNYDNISSIDRNAIFKSAHYMEVEKHTELLKELLEVLKGIDKSSDKKRIITSGIVADSPEFLSIFDNYNLKIVGDDIGQESRLYRTDTPEDIESGVRALAERFGKMENCSILFDKDKMRADLLVNLVKDRNADGVVFVLTKFSDPEEFDYVIIKKALDHENIPSIIIEIDSQMTNYEQAQTMLQTFKEIV